MYTTGHAALVTRNSHCRNTCSFRQYRPVPARVENAYIPLINTLISLVQTSPPSPCEDDGPSDTSPSTQAHSSAGCREKRKMVRFQRTPRRIRFIGLANSCQICSPPFDPSIWNAAVAVPHSNPSGNWRTFMRGVLRLPGKLKRTNCELAGGTINRRGAPWNLRGCLRALPGFQKTLQLPRTAAELIPCQPPTKGTLTHTMSGVSERPLR